MSEAAAIEKPDNLITESQSQTEEAPKLFPLDRAEIVRELEVVYDEDTKITLYHKLKWPTFEALLERQRQTPYKTQVLGGGVTRSYNDNGAPANARLWGKFATEVKGYEWNGVDPDHWAKVTEELKAEIPFEHKSEAIIGMFESDFEIEMSKVKGYVLGAQTYRVKQTYGPYTIYHIFGRPSERDRQDLTRKSHEVRNQPGSRKGKREVFTNLKPYVETYDKLFDHLEGVAGADPNIAHRKDLVNALWKLGAI